MIDIYYILHIRFHVFTYRSVTAVVETQNLQTNFINCLICNATFVLSPAISNTSSPHISQAITVNGTRVKRRKFKLIEGKSILV